MKFFTPERKKNIDWVDENIDTIVSQYDGKCILVNNNQIIDSSLDEEGLYNMAKKMGLDEQSFVVLIIGSAIPREVESGIWW